MYPQFRRRYICFYLIINVFLKDYSYIFADRQIVAVISAFIPITIVDLLILTGGAALKKLLAIFDTDALYAFRLMEYFKKLEWECFDLLLFTRRECLIDFLRYQALDILLYGDDDQCSDLPSENIKHIFRLSSDTTHKKDKQEIICKYQAAERIASDIMSSYTRLEDNSMKDSHGDIRFVAVFPIVADAGKMTYGWSMAKELSNKEKVLYIAFDLMPTTFILGTENSGESMSELLYYLKERNSDYMNRFKSYLNYSERLSFLTGAAHGFDLLSLSREDMSRFMDDIKEHTDYETVVFYLGIYTEASMEILCRSNEIYIVTYEQPYEELVEREWERQMELIGVQIKNLNLNRINLPT